jgi:hypothetical protein
MNSALRSGLWTRSACFVICLMSSVLATVHPAFAQSSTYPPEVENQCKDDYFRYCSPYALGSDELRRCMEAKGTALSSHCQQALKNAGYVRLDRFRRGS